MVNVPRGRRTLPLGHSGRKPIAFSGGLCLYHDGTISEGLPPSSPNLRRTPYRNVSQLISVKLNSVEETKPAGFLLGGSGPTTIEKSVIKKYEEEPSPNHLWKFLSCLVYSLAVCFTYWFALFPVWEVETVILRVVFFGVFVFGIVPLLILQGIISTGFSGRWVLPGPYQYSYPEIEVRVVGEAEPDIFRPFSSSQLSQLTLIRWAIATCSTLFLSTFITSMISIDIELTDRHYAIYFATSLALLLVCFGDYLGIIFPPGSISLWLERRTGVTGEVITESSAFEFFELYLDLIKDNSVVEDNDELRVIDLLSSNESQSLEFKGSMWTMYKGKNYQAVEEQTKKSSELQDSIVKTIAGFLNTDGGTLLIGVADKPRSSGEEPATVVGIESDFRWLKRGRQDIEGYSHALSQILNDAFGDESTIKLFVNVTFPEHLGLTLCRIDVKSLPRVINGEIYVKTKTMGDEEFFFRASDTTTHASVKSANRYIRHHFEGFSGENNKDDSD